MRSWNELVRINRESLWIFRPGLKYQVEGSAPSQGLEVSGEVVSHHEGQYLRLQRSEVGIVMRLDGGVFDRSVHALDLAIDPRVVDLGQPMFDGVFVTDTIKNVPTKPLGRAVAIPGLLVNAPLLPAKTVCIVRTTWRRNSAPLRLPRLFDRPKYRQRNIIERMFGY